MKLTGFLPVATSFGKSPPYQLLSVRYKSLHQGPFVIAVMVSWLLMPGCQRFQKSNSLGYKSYFESTSKDFERAKRKHELAIERLCENDECLAEQLLREALICDSSFGPAHNTLGKLYFDQRKYYLAAWEFEQASQIMPERLEPINNLGLVFEAVGKYDEAIEQFEIAWGQQPDNAHFLGNLLRVRIRNEHPIEELEGLLRQLIEIDDRTEWVDWARGQLTLNRNTTSDDPVYQQPSHRSNLFEELPPVDSPGESQIWAVPAFEQTDNSETDNQ